MIAPVVIVIVVAMVTMVTMAAPVSKVVGVQGSISTGKMVMTITTRWWWDLQYRCPHISCEVVSKFWWESRT
jgi:hypothetical protein